MAKTGIRILDNKNGIIAVRLADILSEIPMGQQLNWKILFLHAIGHLGDGKSMVQFAKEINDSKDGLSIDWNELNILSKKFDELIDITIIGSKDSAFLKKYDHDRIMNETCDIVIQMVNSFFWEIFSRDLEFIKRLSRKFKETEFLETDQLPDLI